MRTSRYTARIGQSVAFAENVAYDELVRCVLEYVLRAAMARAIDEFDWNQEDLRRRGLAAIELYGNEIRYCPVNDAEVFERLDLDVRGRLRNAGYEIPSLLLDMKKLFSEFEADLNDRTADARETLLREILEA